MSTFKEHLLHCTKKELIAFAKIHHISGYSSLNKAALADRVFQTLSKKETMRPFFLCLSQEETALLTSLKSSRDSCLASRLYDLGYCFLTRDHTYVIPDDLPVLFMTSSDFQKKQMQMSLLTDLLCMSGMLYGCIPLSVLTSIYCHYTNVKRTTIWIKEMSSNIPEYLNPMILIDDLYVQNNLVINDLYKKVQKCQGLISYYIPPKETALHFARYGYFNDLYSNRLTLYFTENLSLNSYHSRDCLIKLQSIFRQGGSLLDAVNFLKSCHLISDDIPNKSLMILLNDMFIHTRLLLNRGYTEQEKISQTKNTKKIKVSPNSPCPCGSGKKYKKCCGKH